MSVYMIASYDVINPEKYEQYIYAADPVLEKYKGEILVADDEAKNIEGKSARTNVVIKFNSETDAMSFYNDSEYTSIKHLRLESTENNIVTLSKEFALEEA